MKKKVEEAKTETAVPQGKKEKKKRKKRDHFIPGLILVFLFVGGLVGAKVYCNHLALADMEKFASQYPFTFAEGDSMGYVTQDFSLATDYSVGEENYSVTWSCQNKGVQVSQDGQVSVTCPQSAAKNITLVQTYKKYIGKAKREFTLVLIPTEPQTEDDFTVVAADSVKDGSYQNEMQMTVREDGQIKYMMGDFGETHIYCKEDALALANAYKANLGIGDEISLQVADTDWGDLYCTYTLQAYYGDRPLAGSTVSLTVKKENFYLEKITCSDIPDVSAWDSQASLDLDTIVGDYVHSTYGADINFIGYQQGDMEYNGERCVGVAIVTSTDQEADLYISYASQSVVGTDNPLVSFDLSDVTGAIRMEDATGIDERDNILNFSATHYMPGAATGIADYYTLLDLDKNVFVLNNYGSYELSNSIIELLWGRAQNNHIGGEVGQLADYAGIVIEGYGVQTAEAMKDLPVCSTTADFGDSNSQACETYVALQDAYEFYADQFDYYSYDGEDSEIFAFAGDSITYDNASWDTILNIMRTNPAKDFQYSVAVDPEVLIHEYTHGVFHQKANFSSNTGIEMSGINEGYADIMACLCIDSDDWKIGENIEVESGEKGFARDIANYNGDDLLENATFAETYYDKYWEVNKGEEHAISILISHVAYEMYKSDLFTKDEVADIFFNSMDMGYAGDSTMVDAREYIIETAEDLGCSEEQVTFIGDEFDKERIYDPTSDKWEDRAGVATYKTIGQIVEGDIVYDDSNEHSYLVFTSPIGIVMGYNNKLYILEESTGAGEEDQERAKEYAETTFNNKLEEAGINATAEVEYHQVPGKLIDWTADFLGKTDSGYHTYVYDSLDIDTEEDQGGKSMIDSILQMGLFWEYYDTTAYHFYRQL